MTQKTRKNRAARAEAPAGADVLAFGAHPDDIELTVGGTLHKLAQAGFRVAGIDLTGGEQGTRGTPAIRRREAARAAAILGLSARECLELPDAGLVFTPEQRRVVAAAIRRHRPALVLAPWVEDLHPDHAAAGRLVQGAFMDARLAKLAGPEGPWFARLLLHYPCRHYRHPTLVVDVSDVYPVKKRAFRAHRSQMTSPGRREFRPPGVADPFSVVEVRDRHFGSLIGVAHGEGLVATAPLPCPLPTLLIDGGGRGTAGT